MFWFDLVWCGLKLEFSGSRVRHGRGVGILKTSQNFKVMARLSLLGQFGDAPD
jgi:hypothetical protein